MSFPTLPTFADSEVLTASQLNLLVDAAEYLDALGTSPQPGMLQQVTTGSTYVNLHYLTRFTGNYFHVVTNADVHGKLKVTIDGNVIIDITTLDTGYKDNVSSTLAGLGLTAGAWYDVLVQFTASSGTNRICWAGLTSSATALL